MRLRSHTRAQAAQQQQQQHAAPAASNNASQNTVAPQQNATATAGTRRAGTSNRRPLRRTGSLVVTDSNGQPLARCDVQVGEDGVHTLDRQGSITFTSAANLARESQRGSAQAASNQSLQVAPSQGSSNPRPLQRYTTPAPRPVPDQEDPLRAPHRPTTRPDLRNHRVFFVTDDEDPELAEIPIPQHQRAPRLTQTELLRETHADAMRNQLRQLMLLTDEDLLALRETDVLHELWKFQRERLGEKTRKGLGPEGTILVDENGEALNPEAERQAEAAAYPLVSFAASDGQSSQGLQPTATPCPNGHALRSPYHHNRPVNPNYHRRASTHRHPRLPGPPIPSTPSRRMVQTPHRPKKPAHGTPAGSAPGSPTPARNGPGTGKTPARLTRLLHQPSTSGDWGSLSAQAALVTDSNGAGPSSTPGHHQQHQPAIPVGHSPGRGVHLRREMALENIPEDRPLAERSLSPLTPMSSEEIPTELEEDEDSTPQPSGKGKRRV
ncbi:hypothetical protein K525DRAFT_284672 [Schizophyllum commune Loenen D]|nr:hypothetical protein K525DRAFT_284672 [Schizophyllum commune Loenen D]